MTATERAPVAAGGPSSAPSPSPSPPPREGPIVDRGTVRRDEVRARDWVLHGIAKVVGGADVGGAELDGTAVVGGPFRADRLAVVGSLDARSTVTVAHRLTVHGSVDAGGAVHAGEASFRGVARLGADLVVDATLAVRGQLHASSVRCGTLELRGTATVPGPVVGTAIDVDLVADSAIGSIQCRELRLRGPAPSLVQRMFGNPPVATVERVEAETVRIEEARVRFVRAARIFLGRNAHVATLEGQVVRAHSSSRVGPESWSRPPQGLSR